MIELVTFTNIHGHKNYGIVLSYSSDGSMIQVLWDAFVELMEWQFSQQRRGKKGAINDTERVRVRWSCVNCDRSPGSGLTIEALGNQSIRWSDQTFRKIQSANQASPDAAKSRLDRSIESLLDRYI